MCRIRFTAAVCMLSGAMPAAADDTERLIAAMLGETPVLADLRELTDTVGGRVTGSAANETAVEWALARYREAEVSACAEAFEMPEQWRERRLAAAIAWGFASDDERLARQTMARSRS